jgi:Domain of unknown function (DUF3459)
VQTVCDADLGWLVLRRGPGTVAVNLGTADWSLDAGPGAELLAASDLRVNLAGQRVVLPPDSVAIVSEAHEA